MKDLPPLAPTLYQRELRDYLRRHEPELWTWFSSQARQSAYAEKLRLDLLKSAYRLTPGDYPELYKMLQEAQTALGVSGPVTVYQAQGPDNHPNAVYLHLPEESHILISGPLLTLLSPAEFLSVLAHELSHRVLWTLDGGDYLTTDRILQSAAADPRADAVHRETFRRYQLHTELFADRGALIASRDLPSSVSALVKITTGLSSVRGETYLAQAEEVVLHGREPSTGKSHPETYLRAYALAQWAESRLPDEDLAAWVSGPPKLDQLDLLDQAHHTALTRRFLGQFLRPEWFKSDAVLAQARHFFPDFTPASAPDPTLLASIAAAGDLADTFYSFLLLDFVRVDPDLNDHPAAWALRWASALGVETHFEKLLTKELGLKPKEISRVKAKSEELLGKPLVPAA